jgi:hypothetical protein
MTPHLPRHTTLLALLIALAFGSIGAESAGCGGALALDENAGVQGKPRAYDDPQILAAEDALRDHRLRDALAQYDDIARSGDVGSRGTAAAGRAVVTLMLLPDDPAVRATLVQHLGATRPDYDAERLIWADGGVLYWLARGTSWEDNGQLQGIRSLVADQLPWSSARLASPDAFLAGLSSTGSEALDALMPVTATLQAIEADLDRALADSAFERFYIPAEVFYDADMGLALGRAELALLRGVVALARGALAFIAAYEHSWRLDHLAQAYWTAVLADPNHPEHDAALADVDAYLYSYLDDKLLRSFRDASRLADARRALQRALESWATALELGRERSATGSSLQWQSGSATVSEQLAAFIRAVSSSMERPTALPHTRPAAMLNLSVFFGDGRLIPAATPLFERRGEEWTDEQGQPITKVHWDISEAAIQHMTQGVLSPDGIELSLELSDGGLEDFRRAVSGELEANVSDAYLGAR